ncbi:MAG: pyrroline-5-carboxylate reductase [Alphaproteobacteria bacterium]
MPLHSFLMGFAAITAGRPLVLVGAGKMGSAMLSGWLASGLDPSAVVVVDPGPPSDSETILADAGLTSIAEPPGDVQASVVVLAVKPQTIKNTLPSLRGLVGDGTLVVSIAAGTSLQTLMDGIGANTVVRAMPNTPAQIGKGMTVLAAASGVDAEQRELATELMAAVGSVEWIEDEGLIDAATAISGSGPAYVFLLAECLADAGVEAGLSAELSRRLADATVIGAGALMDNSETAPSVLRTNVTSPGGTTAAAIEVLTAQIGLSQLIRRAVSAAKKRAGELG